MKTLTLILSLSLALTALYLSPPSVEWGQEENPLATRRRLPTVDELMDHYFGDVKVAAYKVFKCESGLRPNATNHNSNNTTDRGIAQINSVHAAKVNGDLDSLYDPRVNLRVARQIYNASGWSPWVCARKVLP